MTADTTCSFCDQKTYTMKHGILFYGKKAAICSECLRHGMERYVELYAGILEYESWMEDRSCMPTK